MSRREVRVINRVFTAREPIERAGVRTSSVVHRCLSPTHQSAKYKSSMKYLMLASLPSYAKLGVLHLCLIGLSHRLRTISLLELSI